MFGNSGSNNTTSFFNQPATSTSTPFGGTGTTTGAGGGIFGNNNSTSNSSTGGGLFGNSGATTNTGGFLFGNSNSTSGASSSAPSTTNAPLFGSGASNSTAAPTSGASLFGAPASNAATPMFGAGTSTSANGSATTPSVFGTSTSTAGTSTTVTAQPLGGSGLFGSNTNSATTAAPGTSTSFFSKPATTGTSLFSTNTNQQQQQQQQQQESAKKLDLATCFPDTKAPHFIIQPNSIKRSTVPSSHWMERKTNDRKPVNSYNDNTRNLSLFHTMDTTPIKSATSNASGAAATTATSSGTISAYSSAQSLFGSQLDGKTYVLPPFLTSTEQNLINPSKPTGTAQLGTKRPLDDDSKANGRNVLAKNQKGVFSTGAASDTLAAGFNINLKNFDNVNTVPTESIADVGVADARVKERMALLAQEQRLQANAYHINHAETTHNMELDTDRFFRPTTTGAPSYLPKAINNNGRRRRVRVLGFDSSNTEEVINYFKGLGELIEPCTSHGNWITFHYVHPESAQKAIESHGMIIGRDRMIGVAWDETAKELEVLQFENANIDHLFKRASSNATAENISSSHPISSSATSQQQQKQHQYNSSKGAANATAFNANTSSWQSTNSTTPSNANPPELKRTSSSLSFFSTLKDKLLGW